MPFIAPFIVLYDYWPAEGGAPGSWVLAELDTDNCFEAPYCACNKDCTDLSVHTFSTDAMNANNHKPGEYTKLTPNWQHRVRNIANEDCIEANPFLCEHGLNCCLCHSCSCKVCSTGCCYANDGQLEQSDYQAMPSNEPPESRFGSELSNNK